MPSMNSSTLPIKSLETGPLPDDLVLGYRAAEHIASFANIFSRWSLSRMSKGARRHLHMPLKDLRFQGSCPGCAACQRVFTYNGKPDPVFTHLIENVQEFNAARDRPVVYEFFVCPNAHLVCAQLRTVLLDRCWVLAQELGLWPDTYRFDVWDFEKCDLSVFGEQHGNAIHDHFTKLALPPTELLIAELQMEVSKVVQRRRYDGSSRPTTGPSSIRISTPVIYKRPKPLEPKDRLKIDIGTGSVSLDNELFAGIDPRALQALKVIADHPEGITTKNARAKLHNCNHDKTFNRLRAKLPPDIRKCIRGFSGSGLHLILPPLS